MEHLLVNEDSAQPTLFGFFPGEKPIFFGKIAEKEYCALVIPAAREAAFRHNPRGFAKEEVTLFYGKNLTLDGYPVIRANGVIKRGGLVRWFCQADADSLEEKQLTITLIGLADYRFNNRPIQKVFITF